MKARRRIQRMIALEWSLCPWAIDAKRLQDARGPNAPKIAATDANSTAHGASSSGHAQEAQQNNAPHSTKRDKEATRRRLEGILTATSPYNLALPPTPRAPLVSLTHPQETLSFIKAHAYDVQSMRRAAWAQQRSVSEKEATAAAGGRAADAAAAAVVEGMKEKREHVASSDQKTANHTAAAADPDPPLSPSVPFPFPPMEWLAYAAGDKRLKADTVNVAEASMDEIQAQLDALWSTLSRRGVVAEAAVGDGAKRGGGGGSNVGEGRSDTTPNKLAEEQDTDDRMAKAAAIRKNVRVTYLICFSTATMGGATLQKLVEDVAMGVHMQSNQSHADRQLPQRHVPEMSESDSKTDAGVDEGTDDVAAAAEEEEGHVVIPIIVGNSVPPSHDIGTGVPLVSFPYCRPYTLVALLQELLLLPRRCAVHPSPATTTAAADDAEASQQTPPTTPQPFTVTNEIVIVSNCLNVVESAVLQAQHSPRQLLRKGAAAPTSEGKSWESFNSGFEEKLSKLSAAAKNAGGDGRSSADAHFNDAILDRFSNQVAPLSTPFRPPPLLDMPRVRVVPFLFHTGHGAGGAGGLPAASSFSPASPPSFHPLSSVIDSPRIEAGLMPLELDALIEYVQHFIMSFNGNGE